MNDIAILGTGMTPFGRHGGDLRALSESVITEVLADAGLQPADIQMVLFGNAVDGVLHGQEMIRAEVALRHSGLHGVPMINIENACASSSSAFQIACMAIASGTAEVVLVLGVERLTHSDKRRSFAALATAVDLAEHGSLAALVGATGAPPLTGVESHSPLMDLYAAKSRSFMDRSGITLQDVAAVSVKNRLHGSLNPLAQFRTPVSAEEVLNSRMIADPLRLLMCAPIGDGGAGLIVTSAAYARRSGRPHALVSAVALTSNGADHHALQPVARAASAAYEQAGIGPDDIDVAEVHDACAPAELWLYEELGLSKQGESGHLVRSGATQIGGLLPVNISGGLIARGHPLGATGCAQLVELTNQLRDRCGDRQVPGAKIALAQNSGGILDDGDEAVAAVTILVRQST